MSSRGRNLLRNVNGRATKWLPLVFIAVAALSRWPGSFPEFQRFYALAFCAGVFFPAGMKWWLPMGTLLFTDLALNLYYYFALGINAFQPFQFLNYAAFGALIWLGTKFNPRGSFVRLLSGGILGAILFYLVTNTAAWLFNPFQNPEYTKDLAGWLIALTKGTSGHPTTLEFFPQYAHERRPVHRFLRRRAQIHGSRRIGQGEGARGRSGRKTPEEPTPDEAKA